MPDVAMTTTNSLDVSLATEAAAGAGASPKRPSMECFTSVMRNTVKGEPKSTAVS
jgi:hypothetical protein